MEMFLSKMNAGIIYRYFLYGYADEKEFSNYITQYRDFNNRAFNKVVMSIYNILDFVNRKHKTNKVPRSNSIIEEAHEITRFLSEYFNERQDNGNQKFSSSSS